jgi:hypothetical protein
MDDQEDFMAVLGLRQQRVVDPLPPADPVDPTPILGVTLEQIAPSSRVYDPDSGSRASIESYFDLSTSRITPENAWLHMIRLNGRLKGKRLEIIDGIGRMRNGRRPGSERTPRCPDDTCVVVGTGEPGTLS